MVVVTVAVVLVSRNHRINTNNLIELICFRCNPIHRCIMYSVAMSISLSLSHSPSPSHTHSISHILKRSNAHILSSECVTIKPQTLLRAFPFPFNLFESYETIVVDDTETSVHILQFHCCLYLLVNYVVCSADLCCRCLSPISILFESLSDFELTTNGNMDYQKWFTYLLYMDRSVLCCILIGVVKLMRVLIVCNYEQAFSEHTPRNCAFTNTRQRSSKCTVLI